MSKLWNTLSEASQRMGETNDCAVRATAVVTGESYEMAHYICEEAGRKPRGGLHTMPHLATLQSLGYTVEMLPDFAWPGKTMRTVNRNMPKGAKYLVHVRGHIAGYDGNSIVDWAANSCRRVLGIYRIVPPTSP